MSVETVRGIRYVKFLPFLKHKQVRDIAAQAVVGFPEVHVGVLAPNAAIFFEDRPLVHHGFSLLKPIIQT